MGKSIFVVIIERKGLGIINKRGQSYDNGSKENVSGVQYIHIKENPRAFFTLNVCHYYNHVLGDVPKISPDAYISRLLVP